MLACLVGCGADPQGASQRGGPATATGGAPASGSGPAVGGGSDAFGNATAATGGGGASGSGDGAGPVVAPGDPQCGGDTYDAQARPLDIYVMMDESLSMVVPTDLWTPVTTALNQFFTNPQTAGIGVGIQFFSGGCDVAPYQTPLVDVADLPGNAAALQSAMAAQVPSLGTATTAALQGAIAFARARQMQMPDRKQAVLLVTDGEPAGCGSTLDNASAAAADGLNGIPSIPTYVLGIGNVDGLNQMAAAGGTGDAFLVDDPTQVQGVVDAINQIRSQALPCEYAIPESSGGFDKTLVNLSWSHDGSTTLVPYVGDAMKCDAAQGGWYYDHPDVPMELVACSQTCDQLRAGGSVSVVLGCPRVVPE